MLFLTPTWKENELHGFQRKSNLLPIAVIVCHWLVEGGIQTSCKTCRCPFSRQLRTFSCPVRFNVREIIINRMNFFINEKYPRKSAAFANIRVLLMERG